MRAVTGEEASYGSGVQPQVRRPDTLEGWEETREDWEGGGGGADRFRSPSPAMKGRQRL
jgi:hypothetical protein